MINLIVTGSMDETYVHTAFLCFFMIDERESVFYNLIYEQFFIYSQIIGGIIVAEPKKSKQEDYHLLDEQVERDVADLFKAFSNPTRIKILFALKHRKLTVSEISEMLSISQSAISHQLHELKLARLVKFEKQGRKVIYELDDDHIHDIFDLAIEHVKELYHYDEREKR